MIDKDITVCKSLNSLTIIKVVLRNIKEGELENKFIFVGYRPENIVNILAKLEKKQKLTSIDIKQLEEAIPHYNTKFGNIQDYNIYFVYHYLEENLNINHARIIIYEAIKEKLSKFIGKNISNYQPHNILLYKFSRNLDYKHFINLLNYIFENNTELSNEDFFNRLYKITYLSKKQINKKLKTLLQAKYKDTPNEVSFITKDTYIYEDCLNNEDIYHLLISMPTILTIKYSYVSEGAKYYYYGYQNIDYIINNLRNENQSDLQEMHTKTSTDAKKDAEKDINKDNRKYLIKDIKFFIEQTINTEGDDNLSLNLSFFNKTINNEYFVITFDEVKSIFPKNMQEFYFPQIETKLTPSQNDDIYSSIYSKFKLNTIRKNIYNDNILTIDDCFCRNIIFDSLSNKLNITYDLKNLYNNLSTTYYIPVIKYVSSDEVKYIKLNKNFLLNHTYLEINKLLINTEFLKNSTKYNVPGDYIQHKWRISKNIILTINFYSNGYTIVYFDDDNNLRISDTLMQYLKLVPKTIKYIKKIINAKKLIEPNISNVFNEYSESINYSTLLNGNIIMNAHLDIDKLQTIDENKKNHGKLDVKLLLTRIKKYFSACHQFIVSTNINAGTTALKIFYKQVNKFYSDENIVNFLGVSVKRMGDKPNKVFLDNLFKNCQKLFLITEDKVKKIYENLDNITIKSQESLLYAIEVEFKVDSSGAVDLKFENVDKYHSIKLILFYLKSILSNIAHDIEKGTFNEDSNKSKYSLLDITKKGKSISKSDKSVVNEKDSEKDDIGFDFDLDLDINLDLDIDIDLDVPSKLKDESELDNDIRKSTQDLNIKDLARLIQFEKIQDDKTKSKSNEDNDYKHIELAKIFGKNKKLSFTKYMNEMRDVFDKQLFDPDIIGGKKYEYGRACQATDMKQPYIVTKKDIESYDDPEAFNGYIKYRGNYYICPRIWDYKANKPISVKKFIEYGLKSPYTNGIAIPPDQRKTIELDDKYTVIIRKPAGSVWEDPNKYPEWPELLKQTEKEAYPYLMAPSDHPQKLCIPCCGSKKPEDFDPNKREIQQIFKPPGHKECRQKLEEEEHTDKEDKHSPKKQQDKQETLLCSSSIELLYITNEISDLDKCRCGLLPKNLDIMLNNHQNLFLRNQTQLMDNSNLFLRIGVDKNKKDNILETFSVIYGMSLQGLKSLISNKLTPEVFINLNNGELIDIYSSNNILPNSLYDYDKFATFMKNYILFFNILDIDYSILEKVKYKDIEFLNYHIQDNTQLTNYVNNAIKLHNINKDSKDNGKHTTALYDITDDITNIKKLIISYKIYSAFYNYIGHILNENEYKNYTHFLDLFSKPIEWLNKDGANILIFDKNASKMMCNPYNDIQRSKYVILIRDDKYHFIPVIHVNNIHKNTPWEGIFTRTKINITDATYNYFEKRITNKKLLQLTKERDNALIRLIIIHSNICKYQFQQQTQNFLKELHDNDIKSINQIAFTTTQIEFIKLDKTFDNILIPIYPTAINARQMNMKFKLLHLDDMHPLEQYITLTTNIKGTIIGDTTDTAKPTAIAILKNKLVQYNYKISKIFYDEVSNTINSIQFINNLIVPIQPEKYTISRKNEIISLLIKKGELKNIDDQRIPTLFRPAYFDFQLEISPMTEILNIRNSIYKDFIYNYFKYDFSRLLQENTYKLYKTNLVAKLVAKLVDYNKNDIKIQDTIDVLIDNIINIMQNRISNKNGTKGGTKGGTKDDTKDGNKNEEENKFKPRQNIIKLKVCSKTKKAGKCTSKFCTLNEDTKQCYLDMNTNQLEYFAYLLANDLVNNKLEAREIINGSFIPEFNTRNKIFRNPDEIIINPNELANIIESGIFSKFKKNITLSEYLANEDEYIFSNNDYTILENTNMEEFKKMMNTIIPDVVDLSIKNIFLDDKVFTTPFNKQGTYDTNSNLGECKFPFFEKNRKKFVYQCIPRTGGVMCPTKIDYQRKPDKWGYCPEKIQETNAKLNVIQINTEGDGKEYKEGKCLFPHMEKQKSPEGENIYNLKYDCFKDNEGNFEWCPLRPNSFKNSRNRKTKKHSNNKLVDEKNIIDDGDLLRAADKFENVQLNKWYNGKLSITGINTKKHQKGYCQPPPVKTKKAITADQDIDKPEITLDNYIPNNCNANFTPSKGGYGRDQLVNFGTKYLKIPYSKLYKDEDIKLTKPELCKIINDKFREIKIQGKEITDEDRKKAYGLRGKNIDDCEKGESKGGYSWNELKELAINYYGITEQQAQEMKKPELCDHIKKVIKQITSGEIIDENALKGKEEYKFGIKGASNELSMIYPHNINLCKETPNRGGVGSKEIKKIAQENFGIDTEHKHKDKICDEIEAKLKEQKEIVKKIDRTQRDTRLSATKIAKMRYSFNGLFDKPEQFAVNDDADIDEDEDEKLTDLQDITSDITNQMSNKSKQSKQSNVITRTSNKSTENDDEI